MMMMHTRPGCLIAVVGPSGAGKDSLLNGAREQLPHVHFMRRIITRPHNAGGEDHIELTKDAFTAQITAGKMLFHWQAHDLDYGISIDAASLVRNGNSVVFNGSRAALVSIEASKHLIAIIISSITSSIPTIVFRNSEIIASRVFPNF